MRLVLLALVLSQVVGCADSSAVQPANPSILPASSSAAAVVEPESAAAGTVEVPPSIQAIVDAADRSEEDRALDGGRHPGELLAYFDIRPGMRVGELMAGRGYTAELLSRAVGATGTVYAQNNRFVLEKFAQAGWTKRLTQPVNANIVRVDRELDDPLPPEAKNLDVVFLVLFYHDSVWLKTDRAKLNAAVFAALKPGGVYAVVDHSAAEGAGLDHVKTLHRIEESVLRKEVEAAGFKLAGEASFLRNAEDTRDWSASPSTAGERRGQSDRFVLKFVKP